MQVRVYYISITPLYAQDNWPDYDDLGMGPAPSDANTSSRICTRSNDSDSTKYRLKSWIRWQGRDSHNEDPPSPSLADDVDTLRHEIHTEVSITVNPSQVSDSTDHDELRGEVSRLRTVCTFDLAVWALGMTLNGSSSLNEKSFLGTSNIAHEQCGIASCLGSSPGPTFSSSSTIHPPWRWAPW